MVLSRFSVTIAILEGNETLVPEFITTCSSFTSEPSGSDLQERVRGMPTADIVQPPHRWKDRVCSGKPRKTVAASDDTGVSFGIAYLISFLTSTDENCGITMPLKENRP
jgi:hypothetical protein